MKNPNGYGTVYKLSGNRRKPYAAVVPIGRDPETGKLKRKVIGHYASRREGLTALADYNRDPYLPSVSITFAQVYEGWHADKWFGDYNLSTENTYAKAFKAAAQFHDKAFRDIRLAELQAYCDTKKSHNQASRFKALVSQMSEWAISRDHANRNYAESIVIKQSLDKKKDREPFNRDEIEQVFAVDTYAATIVKIGLYTGCRIGELLALKWEDVDLDKRCFYVRKAKTENGVRIVPIHSRILPFFEVLASKGNTYVFTNKYGKKLSYEAYVSHYFNPLMQDLGLDHNSHEMRHTLISIATIAGCNPTIIKKIVGHVSAESLTERVYTHIGVEDLLAEIEKIP